MNAAADLHSALRKAGVAGPYLLVGHSIGGLHAQVFAGRYPADTAGLVLISSTHPDQIRTWLTLLPPAAPDEEKAITETRALLTGMAEEASRDDRGVEAARQADERPLPERRPASDALLHDKAQPGGPLLLGHPAIRFADSSAMPSDRPR